MEFHHKGNALFKSLTKPLGATCIAIMFVTALASCANTTPHISGGNTTTKQPVAITLSKVIILPPLLQYESITTEKQLSPSEYRGGECGKALSTNSSAILQEKGCQTIDTVDSPANKAYSDIFSKRNMLLKGEINKKLIEQMKRLSVASGSTQILALMTKVKVGQKAFFDPIFSGAAASGSSYTRLKAVLYDATTGQRIWNNEVQLLEMPKSNDPEYLEAINMLFENLKLS